MGILAPKQERWEELSSDSVYDGRFLSVKRNNITDPQGKQKTYEIVERSDLVSVVTVLNNQLTLIRVVRYPTNEVSWEFPSGLIDAGETPEQAAIRELGEEAAIENVSMKNIGVLRPLPALMRQSCFVFLATQSQDQCQESQLIAEFETKSVTTEEMQKMISNGEITDGCTLSAFSIFRTLDQDD